MRHLPLVTGGRPKEILMHWSNTGLDNLKGAINGTCRSRDARHRIAASPPVRRQVFETSRHPA